MTETEPVTNHETESEEFWDPVDGMTQIEMNAELHRLFHHFFQTLVIVIAMIIFAVTWMFLRNSHISVLDGLLVLFVPPILFFLLLLLENFQFFRSSLERTEISRAKLAFVSAWLRLFGGKQLALFHSRERLDELLARMPIMRILQDALAFEDISLRLVESNGKTKLVFESILRNQGVAPLTCSEHLVRIEGSYKCEHLDGLQSLEETLKPDKVTTSLPSGAHGVLQISIGIPESAVSYAFVSVAVLVSQGERGHEPEHRGWVQTPEHKYEIVPILE